METAMALPTKSFGLGRVRHRRLERGWVRAGANRIVRRCADCSGAISPINKRGLALSQPFMTMRWTT